MRCDSPSPARSSQGEIRTQAAGSASPALRSASIVAIEALCAAQGVSFRAPLATSEPLGRALARLREVVPPLEEDRVLAGDIAAARGLVLDGSLAASTGLAPIVELDVEG